MAKIKADAAKNKYIEVDKLLYTWDPNRKSGCEDPSTPLQVTANEYRTGNFSSEYQLDESIPSGKMYTNRTEASEWYGETNIRVRTVINDQYKDADATWIYNYAIGYIKRYEVTVMDHGRVYNTDMWWDSTSSEDFPEVWEGPTTSDGYYILGLKDLNEATPKWADPPSWTYDYNKEQSWWTGGGDNKLSLMGMV